MSRRTIIILLFLATLPAFGESLEYKSLRQDLEACRKQNSVYAFVLGDDLREELDRMQKRLDAERRRLDQSVSRSRSLKGDAAKMRGELRWMEGKNKQLLTELDEIQRELDVLRGHYEQIALWVGSTLPGRAQVAEGERVKGNVMTGLLAGLMVLNATAAYEFQHSKEQHERTSERNSRKAHMASFGRFRHAGNQVNALLAFTVVLYAFNLYDRKEVLWEGWPAWEVKF